MTTSAPDDGTTRPRDHETTGLRNDGGQWAGGPAGSGQSLPVHDCWNRIGIRGDGSCAELERFVHCRNCPVYTTAGAQLLDRELPADYRREWTALFARAREESAAGKMSVVIFRIGEEWLALPTGVFQEVVPLVREQIHSLPGRMRQSGGIVLGLTSVRGELLICVSLGRLLQVESKVQGPKPLESGTERTLDSINPAARGRPGTGFGRLMILGRENQRLAFPVDEVHGIHRFDPHEVKEVPATLARAHPAYTAGMLEVEVARGNELIAAAAGQGVERNTQHSTPQLSTSEAPPRLSTAEATSRQPSRPHPAARGIGLLDAELVISALNRSLS